MTKWVTFQVETWEGLLLQHKDYLNPFNKIILHIKGFWAMFNNTRTFILTSKKVHSFKFQLKCMLLIQNKGHNIQKTTNPQTQKSSPLANSISLVYFQILILVQFQIACDMYFMGAK